MENNLNQDNITPTSNEGGGSEEVKKDPRFQNSIASVNSLAEKTVAVIKNDPAIKGSRESLNSQTGNCHI